MEESLEDGSTARVLQVTQVFWVVYPEVVRNVLFHI